MRKSDADQSISRSWKFMLVVVAFRENSTAPSSEQLWVRWRVDAFVPGHQQRLYPNAEFSPLPSSQAAPPSTQLFADHEGAGAYGKDTLISENDAIKILRAFPRDIKNHAREKTSKQDQEQPNLTACSSAQDVLKVLHQSCFTYEKTDYDHGVYRVGTTVNAISPNVASSALRRLVSPPFLPASFSTTKKGIQYLNKQPLLQNDVSELEKRLYIQLTTMLQEKLHDCMKDQMESLSSLAEIGDDSVPMLLPKNSTLDHPPMHTAGTSLALDWYALADLSFSAAVLINLPKSIKQKSARSVYLQTIVETQVEKDKPIETFDTIIRYLSFNNEITSSFLRCIGPRRIVRDVLSPLVVVESAKQRNAWAQSVHENEDEEEFVDSWLDRRNKYEEYDRDDEGTFVNTDSFTFKSENYYILQVISSYLSLPHALEKLNCADLAMALWSFVQIYFESKSYDSVWTQAVQDSPLMGEVQINMIRSFMKRLRKVSIHSMGSGKVIAQAIWSVDRLMGLMEAQYTKNDVMQDNFFQWESRLMDEIQLPGDFKVPGEQAISQVSDEYLFSWERATPTLDVEAKQITSSPPDRSTVPFEKIREEAVIMLYTMTKELLRTDKAANNYCKLRTLNLEQLADILQAAISLKIPLSDCTELIRETINTLTMQPPASQYGVIDRCNNSKQISRTMWSLQRLRVGSGQFGAGSGNITKLDAITQSEEYCIQLLGERFLAIVREQEEGTYQPCEPKTLATVLRSGVMMFSGKSVATNALLEAASYLILGAHDDENRAAAGLDIDSSPFLLSCNEFEVSNFLFAFALARRFDEDVFMQLTAQMLEVDLIESCTATSASRAMWSCASLLSLSSGDSFLYERQVDFFHQLSGILLSSQLTPTDCSSAMWAMARCGYVLDRGVFDFLAEKLSGMLENANCRLVSQALWACAKMSGFEEYSSGQDNQPPYMASAEKFVRYLIANGEQMTPLHTSRSIWAVGCLQLSSDPSIVNEMASIALHKATLCNSQEIANIVWGLSKVNYDNPKVVSELVRHITESVNLKEECSPQEASNVLYALGKLRICDGRAFDTLSSILMNQLQDASSQAIANALWAYDAVGLETPIELMGGWAREKFQNLEVCMESPDNNF